jgi:hypothetical protein
MSLDPVHDARDYRILMFRIHEQMVSSTDEQDIFVLAAD